MTGRYLFSLLVLLLLAAPARGVMGQECTATTVVQFNQILDQSRSRIYLVKFDDALERLSTAEAQLSCLAEPLPRESLSRLYLYRGVAAFNKGNESEAMTAFKQAVAMDRGTRWDERFGQRPREVFVEAKELVLLAPKGNLKIPALKPRVLVYIDGEPVAAPSALPVPPGKHFIQLKAEDKMARSELLDVASEANLDLPLPAEVVMAPVVPKDPGTGKPTEPGKEPRDTKPPKDPKPPKEVKPKEEKPPKQPKPPKPPFDKTRLRPVAYGVMGVGGLGLLTGVGAGVVTFTTQQKLKDEYYQNRPDAEKDALMARQKLTALVADGGFGAAVLFGGAGTALYFVSRPPADKVSSRRPTVYPWVSVGVAGLSVQGRF